MKGAAKEIINNVLIGDLTEGNQCVARVDNAVFFVSNATPGDVMDIEVIKKKKGYAFAIPVQLHRPSPYRAQPFCTHFGTCGGCQWQHITYDMQLAAKELHVKDKLIHLAQIPAPVVAPIIRAEKTRYYRNKLEYTFASKRWLTAEELNSGQVFDRRGIGFHKALYFDKVVDLSHCYLQTEPSNAIRTVVAQFAKEEGMSFYDFKSRQGFLRNLIIRTTATGEVMVILQVGYADQLNINRLMVLISEKFPSLASLQYVVNTKFNETFYDLTVHCYSGNPFITEQIDELQWRIGPKSFFQTNTQQAGVLYRKIVELAALKGNEVVYDLYTGVGTIAHFLARHAHHVMGIEIIEAAVEDARINAALNQLQNVTFYAGDMKEVLLELYQSHPLPDLIITDPPRAGMHPAVINALLQMGPSKIIYVSCNPATQARDIYLLQQKYSLELAQPIDMFPQTSHVENIALLIKN